MLIWYVATAAAGVWAVFDSPALDYRFVMLGAVLPVAEVTLGQPGPLHSIVTAVAVLALVMLVTQGRRIVRRLEPGDRRVRIGRRREVLDPDRDLAELEVRVGLVVLDRDGLFEDRDRVVEQALLDVRAREPEARAEVILLQLARVLVLADRVVELPELVIDGRELISLTSVLRVD